MKNVLERKRSSSGARRAAWPAFVIAGLVLSAATACERVATAPGADRSANEVIGARAGSIGGTVVTLDGKPVAGAVVTTPGGQSAVTGADGSFAIKELAPAERLAVDVSASGFASTTRIYKVVAGEELSREIRLIRQGAPVALDAGKGGVVRFSDAGVVEVPANAFAGVSPGERVNVRVSYFDPADAAAFREAPGDFTGIEADGSRSVLSSNGMISISATDARGRALQLAEGQSLRASLPNRVVGGSRESWGLYRLVNGNWVFVGPTTETNQRFFAQVDVNYNIDKPIQIARIPVRVLDGVGSPVRNTSVAVASLSYFGGAASWTDGDGFATMSIGAGQQVSIQAGSGSATITTPSAGTTGPVTTIIF